MNTNKLKLLSLLLMSTYVYSCSDSNTDSSIEQQIIDIKTAQSLVYNINIKQNIPVTIKLKPSIVFIKENNYKATIFPCMFGALQDFLGDTEYRLLRKEILANKHLINENVVKCVERMHKVRINDFDFELRAVVNGDKDNDPSVHGINGVRTQ